MSIGIDYGMGQTNIDTETGIRFGVIHAHEVGQSWYDSSEAEYGPPHCPKCGNQADEPSAFGDSFKVDGRIDCYEFDGADEYTDEDHECRDYVCVDCQHFFGSESAFGDEPLGHYYKDDEYFASQSDSDIFIERSPYYTYAPFCSPCAPGACYLMTPLEPSLGLQNNRAYCFGHDWFEDGQAPYRVFRVSDNTEVVPEGGK